MHRHGLDPALQAKTGFTEGDINAPSGSVS
jgi:hypothetical protein